MKVFLVNLDRNPERLAAADRQLRQCGVDYERMPAVDGKLLSKEEQNAAVDGFRLWCSQGRKLRPGEIGCAMSHYSIYRRMIKEELDVACILEDDVILDQKFKTVLDQVRSWIDIEKRQVCLLSNHTGKGGEGIVRSAGDQYTEGYVLTRGAAIALLSANWPMQVPCDHWHRWVRRKDIELYHAFPSVCTQDQSRYLSNTGGGGRLLQIIHFGIGCCTRRRDSLGRFWMKSC